jgi:hypothetical protein
MWMSGRWCEVVGGVVVVMVMVCVCVCVRVCACVCASAASLVDKEQRRVLNVPMCSRWQR